MNLQPEMISDAMQQDGDDPRQRCEAGEDAFSVTRWMEKSGAERKHEGSELSLLGRGTAQGASPGPGMVHDCHKPYTCVKHQYASTWHRLWYKNRSYLLVIISVVFGSAMTLFTKLLESGNKGMHPLRILFFRMVVTSVLCIVPFYIMKDSGSLLGPRKLRWVLVFRGISGFFGLCGIWMSISEFDKEYEGNEHAVAKLTRCTGFLDLADATVITFLTPSMVAIFSAIFRGQPFTRKEQLASLLAMLGVVFIARPAILFGSPVSAVAEQGPHATVVGRNSAASDRLTGTVLALISATGGAGAFIAIRSIGDRVSILTTTLYFAVICTIISGTALAIAPLIDYGQPDVRFGLAEGATQWALMAGIVLCGLMTQLLLTAGLGGETKTNKAPAMVYTGMVWTAGFDRWVFGEQMYWSSLVGCTLIVGGAIWMVVQPQPAAAASRKAAQDVEAEAAEGVSDESTSMAIELRLRDGHE